MSCTCGKAGFASERDARSVARHVGRGRKQSANSSDQKPYPCPDDPKVWHLSSQGKLKRRK